MYAVILNFETGQVDRLYLGNKPENQDIEQYIERDLDYSLSDCEWMVWNIVNESPFINRLNY